MKLKTKLIIAFISVMLVPLILMGTVTVAIVNREFKQAEIEVALDDATFQSLANPITRANRFTREAYNEIKLCASKTPERLETAEYCMGVNNALAERSSALLVKKNAEYTYIGNIALYNRVADRLPAYEDQSAGGDEGVYVGGDVQVLFRQKDFVYRDGSKGTVYILTDVNYFSNQTRGSVILIIDYIVVIMFFTSLILAIWIYRSIIKPINALRESTQNMKNGNLDVSVKKNHHDEIGDLCEDFDEMRIHMKELLDDSLRHEQESKDLMVNISHDLKTPLTAIKGYAEGLLDGVAATPEKQEKYLKTIYSKANEMTALVDELSMYAKIDTNSVPYNFVNLNIHSYLGNIVAETKDDLELQDIDMAYFTYIDTNQEVIADPEQLTRCIHNIVANAVKYRESSRRGMITIRVSDIEDGFVRIEIEDNGKGIAMKDLPNIFDRFYRTDSSRNSKTGGSGLGLAIVKKIIDDHGGRIWAESKLGEGTTINILLRKVPEKILESVKPVEEEKMTKKWRNTNE